MSAANLPNRPRIGASSFDLNPFVGINPMRGASYDGVEHGAALWSCEISTVEISLAEGGAYKWLFANRRGAVGGIYLYDAERPRPLAYASTDWLDAPLASSTDILASCDWVLASHEGEGVIAPWGTPRLVGCDAADSTVSLEGLVPGADISIGDYGHWDDGLNRRLHILDAGTADAEGALTLACEPAPPAALIATLPVPFTMEKASAEMVLLEADVSASFNPSVQEARLKALQILPE